MQYVCHAEVNAILNKNSADVKNCSVSLFVCLSAFCSVFDMSANLCQMYVALFPCNECAKIIIQSGITEIVYMDDKYRHTPSMRASRRMLDMAKVQHSLLRCAAVASHVFICAGQVPSAYSA